MGLAPTHAPAWHVSTWVQALPSLQAVPFAATGFVHAPVGGSQAPGTWHGSDAPHTTGLAPTHAPATHASTSVHALPSLHAVPSTFAGFEHAPVAESQVPTS